MAHQAVSEQPLSAKIKENSLVTCPLPHGGSSVRKDPRSEGGNGLDWVGWSLLHPVPDGGDATGRGTAGMACCCCCCCSGHCGKFQSFPWTPMSWECLYPRSGAWAHQECPRGSAPGSPPCPRHLFGLQHWEFPTWESFPTRAFFPFLCDNLKSTLFSLHNRDRTDWFIPL